ncbi:unnamed protein product [Paramecium octaurelia]|uniref:Uncharacterized protein n=1 Tax=Paramecium octaurelia TaxID=43137 RepID=A0A8S1VUS0_PAROT|nr:unnamed protein product [Paramecium octaurelia]
MTEYFTPSFISNSSCTEMKNPSNKIDNFLFGNKLKKIQKLNKKQLISNLDHLRIVQSIILGMRINSNTLNQPQVNQIRLTFKHIEVTSNCNIIN